MKLLTYLCSLLVGGPFLLTFPVQALADPIVSAPTQVTEIVTEYDSTSATVDVTIKVVPIPLFCGGVASFVLPKEGDGTSNQVAAAALSALLAGADVKIILVGPGGCNSQIRGLAIIRP